jgi:hypothetical protein
MASHGDNKSGKILTTTETLCDSRYSPIASAEPGVKNRTGKTNILSGTADSRFLLICVVLHDTDSSTKEPVIDINMVVAPTEALSITMPLASTEVDGEIVNRACPLVVAVGDGALQLDRSENIHIFNALYIILKNDIPPNIHGYELEVARDTLKQMRFVGVAGRGVDLGYDLPVPACSAVAKVVMGSRMGSILFH